MLPNVGTILDSMLYIDELIPQTEGSNVVNTADSNVQNLVYRRGLHRTNIAVAVLFKFDGEETKYDAPLPKQNQKRKAAASTEHVAAERRVVAQAQMMVLAPVAEVEQLQLDHTPTTVFKNNTFFVAVRHRIQLQRFPSKSASDRCATLRGDFA